MAELPVSSAKAGSVATSSVKTSKGEQTRARILKSALDLFLANGYEGTTMRAIAKAAGLSLGSTYYYFKSKENLIQAFYAQTHREHLASVNQLEGVKDFKSRLALVMRAKIDTSMPYHRFAGVLFRTAADPRSALNPFGEESGALREEATELFAQVVDGSTGRFSKVLRAELPNLLWTYQMGVILYWIHDDSSGCARTYRLIDRTVDLITRLVAIAHLPGVRPIVRRVLQLTSELRDMD